MRELPVHLLVDSSCTGSAESFDLAWALANALVNELMSDPMCVEACHLTLWAFGDSARLVNRGQVDAFQIPKVDPGGTKCALGHALYKMLEIDDALRRSSLKHAYKSHACVILRNAPTDAFVPHYTRIIARTSKFYPPHFLTYCDSSEALQGISPPPYVYPALEVSSHFLGSIITSPFIS